MKATLNIFGQDEWSIKITSLLVEGEWQSFNESNYDEGPGDNKWLIAVESGTDREKISSSFLQNEDYVTLFKGLDDLVGVTYGKGLVVGPGSLIRPTTTIGDQVYIGAGTIIDLDCIIEDNVTIGDNVTITQGAIITKGTTIKSGSII